MDSIGPIYCETSLAVGTAFPIEYINTATSFAPVVFGVLALAFLFRYKEKYTPAYVLALLVILTGVGSVLWHGLRTSLTLALDVLPGLSYFFFILYLWPALLGGRYWAYGAIAGLFFLVLGLSFVPGLGGENGPPIALFGGVLLLGSFLTYRTFRKSKKLGWYAAIMMASALLAAIFRTIDLSLCQYIPQGTHFLWHVFLGLAGYVGVILVAKLHQNHTRSHKTSELHKMKSGALR